MDSDGGAIHLCNNMLHATAIEFNFRVFFSFYISSIANDGLDDHKRRLLYSGIHCHMEHGHSFAVYRRTKPEKGLGVQK
jgi:hypothetical protein